MKKAANLAAGGGGIWLALCRCESFDWEVDAADVRTGFEVDKLFALIVEPRTVGNAQGFGLDFDWIALRVDDTPRGNCTHERILVEAFERNQRHASLSLNCSLTDCA